ncbi:uncharacterized protein [Salvelinus alpinus]|uniref:uncharacterized protein isoform X3 n=1 Tax=Salvelinus alpinus TaxID=8036 RepID=UPI0039FC7FC8
MQQGNNPRPSYGAPPQKRFRNANGGANNRRKQPNFSADIVFTTKAGNVQTIPSLTKQLKAITGETVIGLQYVWEYRSPSKSVPPHYQCKLCKVSRLQTDMLAHIKGWKHSFRYMKQNHSAKVPFEEDAATKDHEVRKKVKKAAAELEKAEGRGQLKVILKEPSEVQAFAGLRSAIPNMGPPGGMGARGPKPAFQKRDMSFRGYPDNTGGQRLGGSADGFGLGRDGGFGQEGLLGESPGSRYPDEFRGGQMGSGSGQGLMGAVPETSSLPSTLLKYLDNFQIENEGDAQIVLKVTQKLTDVLMDYRLRSVSSQGPSMKSGSSLGSMSYSDSPRMSSGSDRFSGGFSGNLSGPSRYSDGPSRYYN